MQFNTTQNDHKLTQIPHQTQHKAIFFPFSFSNNCNLFMLLKFFGCMHNKVFCFINKISFSCFCFLSRVFPHMNLLILFPLKNFCFKKILRCCFLCLEFFLLFVFILIFFVNFCFRFLAFAFFFQLTDYW